VKDIRVNRIKLSEEKKGREGITPCRRADLQRGLQAERGRMRKTGNYLLHSLGWKVSLQPILMFYGEMHTIYNKGNSIFL
jgi:hypothetical protein